MDKKITVIIIFITVIIAFGAIYLLSDRSFCLPNDQDIYYCNNTNGAITNKTNKIGFCDRENRIGTANRLMCPRFYESEYSYFLDDKKVSQSAFFEKINEVNISCGGCVVEVYTPVR